MYPKRLVGRELHALHNMIMRLRDNDARNNMDDITGGNSNIIAYLADHTDEDVFQKDIETEFAITRSTVSKVLNLMEQKGLIERRSVPGDARLKKLVLTKKAEEAAGVMLVDRENFEANLVRGISKNDLDGFFNSVNIMKDNLAEILND